MGFFVIKGEWSLKMRAYITSFPVGGTSDSSGKKQDVFARQTNLGACPRIGAVARESHFESDFSII
jgi:hypothetical protein